MSLESIIARVDAQLASKTADERRRLSRSLDMDTMDFIHFQEVKTLAVADGRMSLDVGMEVYGLLGGSASVFNSRSLGTKLVLTQLFATLIKPR